MIMILLTTMNFSCQIRCNRKKDVTVLLVFIEKMPEMKFVSYKSLVKQVNVGLINGETGLSAQTHKHPVSLMRPHFRLLRLIGTKYVA